MNIDNSFLIVLSDISFVSSFVPLLISFVNYKYSSKFLIPIIILIATSITIDFASRVYLDLNINNSYIFHLFTIIEFTLISFFYGYFFKQFFKPRIIYFFMGVFFFIAYLDFKINGLNSIDNFSISIECLILTLYSLFLFYYILKNLIFENLLRASVFWINAAILLYFSGNLLLFLFSNYLLVNNPRQHGILWSIIHTFFYVTYNIFLTIGFWRTKAK
jgi:hypothetical protein